MLISIVCPYQILSKQIINYSYNSRLKLKHDPESKTESHEWTPSFVHMTEKRFYKRMCHL